MDPSDNDVELRDIYEKKYLQQASKTPNCKAITKVNQAKPSKSFSYHSYNKSSLNINNINTNNNTDISNINNVTNLTQDHDLHLRKEIEEDVEEDEWPTAVQEVKVPLEERQKQNVENFIKVNLKVKAYSSTLYEKSKLLSSNRAFKHVANKINKATEELEQIEDFTPKRTNMNEYFLGDEAKDNNISNPNLFEKGKEWRMKVDRKLQAKVLLNNKKVLKECTFSPVVNKAVPEFKKIKSSTSIELSKSKHEQKLRALSQSQHKKIKFSDKTKTLRKQFTNIHTNFMTRRESHITFKENYNSDLKNSASCHSQPRLRKSNKSIKDTHKENCFCCRIKNANKRIDNTIITNSSVQRNTLKGILADLNILNIQLLHKETITLVENAKALINENQSLLACLHNYSEKKSN